MAALDTQYDEKGSVEMVNSKVDNEVGVVAPNDSMDMSFWQSLKTNRKVMMYCLMMSLGPMAFGFDIIIVGVVTAIPAFL